MDRAAGVRPERHDRRSPATSVDIPESFPRRVVIDRIRPDVDNGRFPIKRVVGDTVDVHADIFADGHGVLIAILRDAHANVARGVSRADTNWREHEMTPVAPGTDEWHATFETDAVGWHQYSIVAWVDPFRSWREDLVTKAAAGQDLAVEIEEGASLVRHAAARAEQIGSGARDAERLVAWADALAGAGDRQTAVRIGIDSDLGGLMDQYADRSRATTTAPRRVWVDRSRAAVGAWYEMFPRSSGNDPERGGSFRDAATRLPYIADLGFDVVYLPPIHPIGRSFRKGRNNSPVAEPGDPGSPWAIGSPEGGHTSIDPGLGTFADFEAFREKAERLGLEVALDLAWQCSPDHPWVREHPGWFRRRPDGSIKYAENPPKKYQDILPLDFGCDDWRALWQELLRVTLFWMEHGIRIFRVDNPHTKPFGFWEWLIDQVHARDPEVILLSEAFTRPRVMRFLAKVGFSQSYTYFTWRNTRAEIIELMTELAGTEVREYLRPNLFANTPDILHAYLQHGGRPAFEARLLLAATLGASYGIYNGFELCENRALSGTEEYLDSEKYQVRAWNWDQPGHIKELVARVNEVRRREPALQVDRTLQFHATDNPELIAYSKASPDRSSLVFVVVNLDPSHMQHGWVEVPADWPSASAQPDGSYTVTDLLDNVRYEWRGAWNYVRLDPGVRQGHILKLELRS